MSMSLSPFGKVRCRIFDRASAEPVAGGLAGLSIRADDGRSGSHIPASALVSETTGQKRSLLAIALAGVSATVMLTAGSPGTASASAADLPRSSPPSSMPAWNLTAANTALAGSFPVVYRYTDLRHVALFHHPETGFIPVVRQLIC